MIKSKNFKKATLFFCFILIINLSACNCQTDLAFGEKVNEKQADFSVHYIDVGQGDCFFICFPDGKNLLIDGGVNSKSNYSRIKSYLDQYDCDKIDYLVVTHPDERHIGNILSVIENYSVGQAYLPFLAKPEIFPSYLKIVNHLKQQNVNVKVSQIGESFSGEDYFFCFLSPLKRDNKDSSYNAVNGAEFSYRQLDDISPITYLRYKDVSFVFCSDAGESQEKLVVDYYSLGLYNVAYNGKVDLDELDYLCLSSHGTSSCSTTNFLALLKAKNVMISVGGDNNDNCPSSKVLERLENVNKNYNLFRTDVHGTLSVFVNELGENSVVTQYLR